MKTKCRFQKDHHGNLVELIETEMDKMFIVELDLEKSKINEGCLL